MTPYEELIKKLEEKGFTYKTSDGIYFNTSKLKKLLPEELLVSFRFGLDTN